MLQTFAEIENFRKQNRNLNTVKNILTINVPVVYMGQYEVVLRGTIHNKGHFRGVP